jgi:hypothetical protein
VDTRMATDPFQTYLVTPSEGIRPMISTPIFGCLIFIIAPFFYYTDWLFRNCTLVEQ